MRKYISADNIRPLGEVGARTALLFGRLTDAMYRPAAIFTEDVNGWPGDWEGRTILAQTLLSRITGCESPYLRANIAALSGQLNEKGYLKYILPDGEFNEQQLSGHSWLLRGLCEYYEYSGDAAVLDMAKRIAENLFLPAAGHYVDYPVRKDDESEDGEFAGNITGVVGGWHLSTDTGCAFIPMDGLSHLFELTKDGRLGALLDEMHDKFMTIDVCKNRVQTHATLSACRAILRLYGITGRQKYLDSAAKLLDTYVDSGMSANYANYNWFGRPEWTEPCAIIDSFIVAMRLYEYTGEVRYADLARLIKENGIGRAQRANGGFGCDSCTGAGEDGDIISVRTYEAYWCCTMRGGEGMEKWLTFSYMQDEDEIISVYPASSVASFDIAGGHVRIRQNADGARDGKVVYNVEENTAEREVKLSVVVPGWAGGERVRSFVLPVSGDVIVEYDVPVYDDNRRLMWGDLMLGADKSVESVCADKLVRTAGGFEFNGVKFAPIADSYLMSGEKLSAGVRVLF